MGKLAKFYTKQEKSVELVLELSGDKMIWHRPSDEEIEQIGKYVESLDLDTLGSIIKAQAFVLIMLCDNPDLHNESQAQVEADLRLMEAPDRNCIMPFFNSLMGFKTEDVQRMVEDRFK
jgi:hypothetical protein